MLYFDILLSPHQFWHVLEGIALREALLTRIPNIHVILNKYPKLRRCKCMILFISYLILEYPPLAFGFGFYYRISRKPIFYNFILYSTSTNFIIK